LLEQSIIGPELHSDLVNSINRASASESRLPRLQLKLNAADLIGKVPFFDELSNSRRRALARSLKTRLFVPGDKIISRGDVGDEMYFIANGAVRVLLSDNSVTLGTGDFFGELALITDQPRNADVEAIGFSTLLALKRRDFIAFVRRNPGMRQKIKKIAEQRASGSVIIDL